MPDAVGPSPAPTMRDVLLVVRRGCHLCDEARRVLARVAGPGSWREVDVDQDPGLARFGDLVPALVVDGKLLDYWRLDEAAVRAALAPRGGTKASGL